MNRSLPLLYDMPEELDAAREDRLARCLAQMLVAQVLAEHGADESAACANVFELGPGGPLE